MVRTVNVTFVRSWSTGLSGTCLHMVSKAFFVVEFLLFSLVGLVSVYYMLIHAGVSSGTNIEPVWFVGPTTGTRCMSMFIICSYFRILLVVMC